MNNINTEPYLLSDTFIPIKNSKHKKTRMSEPNLFIEDRNFEMPKTKETLHDNNFQQNRKPRLSYALIPGSTSEGFYSPRHHQPFSTFNSINPNILKEQRAMIKSSSTLFTSGETHPIKINTKNNSVFVEQKAKKNPIEAHKETLNKIEEMLISHGINLDSKEKKEVDKDHFKTKKPPRFSEHLITETEYRLAEKRKENESYGNKKKLNEERDEDIKELKETVSTHSSVKKVKKHKIEDFLIIKEIGKGKFGTVKLAKHIKTDLLFSIKIIKKSVIKKEGIIEQFIKEIKIQSFLNQANIIKLYGVFDDYENVYLLLEFCNEGNLYQYMQKNRKISENETKAILLAVSEAISEMHAYHIMHRDLKPENIVLCYGMAKICDFGWSTEVKDEMRETFCGTPLYVSPELLGGNSYDEKIDLWALGILGYEMLTGKIPFDIKSERDLSKIISAEIIYPTNLSSSAVSFFECILERDPNKRKNIRELLAHPFLQKKKEK